MSRHTLSPDSPFYPAMRVAELLDLPEWSAEQRAKYQGALVRADSFERQSLLLQHVERAHAALTSAIERNDE